MDHYGSACYFVYAESVCQNRHKCEALISKQRRKIPSMRRMRTVFWVVMRTRIGKWVCIISRACGSFVDVETEDVSSAWLIAMG
jgi:hypothetical protein